MHQEQVLRVDHQEHLVPAAISVPAVGWDGAVVYPSYVLPVDKCASSCRS